MGKSKKKAEIELKIPKRFQDTRTIVEQRLDPEANIKPKARAGVQVASEGTLLALQQYLADKPKKRDVDMLHDIVFRDAAANVPWPEISRRTGMPIAECRQIYQKMLDDYYDFTPVQMRKHLTAQVMAIMGMVHRMAEEGSDKHAEILLKATERLAKMHELESQKSTIEITLVTENQTTLFLHIVAMLIERITSIPEIAAAVKPEVIDAITSDVFSIAGEEMRKAQEVLLTSE